MGHQVDNRQVIARRDQRFAGSDTQRLQDLNALTDLNNADVIVLPVRGGYGASRLLEQVDWQGLIARQRTNPLLICGHSDFTVFQLGLLSLGNVITFSGPMLAANFGAPSLNDFTVDHFWRALSNAYFTIEWDGEGPRCNTQGTLWGGNLAMLTSLLGTPWFPAIDGGILVVEDINEHPFRVERMLLQLLHAGVLARQNALILGSFTRSEPNEYDAGYTLMTMVDYLRSRLSIPVITGLEFGHEQQTVTLPLGAHAVLEKSETTRLTISGHPVLSA
jgi:muramoyltetrapeptide carboxypeptidase